MHWLRRRIRGVAGVALTWGVMWGLSAMALGIVIGIVDPDSIDPGEEPYRIGRIVGTVGTIAGAVFATILIAAERNKTVQQLRLWRAVLWGVAASVAVPLLTGINDAVAFTTGPLGAIFSTVTLLVARRGEIGGRRPAD